jgi:hypothetical protein
VGQFEVDEAFGCGKVGSSKNGPRRDAADELRVDEQADFIHEPRSEQHAVQRAPAVHPDGAGTETILKGMKGASQVDFTPPGEKIRNPLPAEAVDMALGRRRCAEREYIPPERQVSEVNPVFDPAGTNPGGRPRSRRYEG